ncbi:peptidoglycan binding domain-containing protein, partial [Streptomyces sp. HSW2009]|uniref:peptidoglycan binding domain-containing protein n=1 Tax=Streptomyces sp. HSW2009 TaxID=3142890 RepID=UPI0032EBB93D
AGKRPSGPPPSGNTVVSGVPAAPGNAGAKPPTDGAGQPPAAAAPAPAPAPAPKPSGAKPKKKGRSKLVMAAVGVVGVVCVAYGAGLVLGHADVPNGTTVLGVDIGGTSKEEAVKKLDTKLGDRTTAPIKLSVDGEELELKPAVAGLSIDTEATVRETAGRDYNPVTVIGSLFGGSREADAKVKVDEEKLRDALGRLAGDGSGSAREGSITFKPGEAVPVYGKAGKSLDADKSVDAVAQAYRDRAESGTNRTVTLPSATKQPVISNAEVDRKMETFAKPAMSGLITVRAGGKFINFGPDRSLPQILSVRVTDGKLVEHYDLDAIKQLYGGVFDGVLVERGNGSKTAVSPTDVAVAMGRALGGKTQAERVAEGPNATLGG